MRIISKLMPRSNHKLSGCEISSICEIPVKSKRAVMDISGKAEMLEETPRYTGDFGDVDNWDELQAKQFHFCFLHFTEFL